MIFQAKNRRWIVLPLHDITQITSSANQLTIDIAYPYWESVTFRFKEKNLANTARKLSQAREHYLETLSPELSAQSSDRIGFWQWDAGKGVPSANLAQILLTIGNTEASGGHSEKALFLFDQALANLAIDDVELRREITVARGNTFFDLEDFEQAATAFRTVIQSSDGNAYAWRRLGNSHYAAGSLDSAEEAFREAIAVGDDDDKAAAWQSLGQLFRARGNVELASAAFRQVIELDVERWLSVAWAGLGRLATDRGDTDQALAAYRSAVSTAAAGERAPYAATLAALLVAHGDLDGAIELHEEVVTSDNDNLRAWSLLDLGSLYHEKGDYLNAQSCFEQAQNTGHETVVSCARSALRRMKAGFAPEPPKARP
jgi:tetratricopeptide (TPR) repeat protein